MNPPEISVVIPVYNTGTILEETIQSVLSQTFTDFELIIIDDGSTDRITLELLDSQNDPRIRVVHQTNGGVAVARNRGISEACGKYIAFMDHDDLFLPEKLAVLRGLFDETPEAVLAFSPVMPFGEDVSRYINLETIDYLSSRQLLRRNLIYSMSCVMIKKETLDRFNIRLDKSCVPCDDWDFYLQLSWHGVFRCVQTPMVKYRIFAGNQSRNVQIMYRAGINVLSKYRKRISFFTSPAEFCVICRGLSDHHYGSALLCYNERNIGDSIRHIFCGFINNPFSFKPWCFFFKKLFRK